MDAPERNNTNMPCSRALLSALETISCCGQKCVLTSATPGDNESLKLWSYFGGLFRPIFGTLAPKQANFPELIRPDRG
jgi:hypothetical protein